MKSLKTPAAADLPPATLSEQDGVRYLHLGTPWVQGAMRIARPQRIELDYVQRMLASLLWRPTDALGEGHAVQLGLGAGALTRFTLQALLMPTTVVEINPHVLVACHTWFRLPRDGALLQVELADAGAWLAGPAAGALHGRTSLLHVDLYDHEAAAPVLDDADFYAACRRLLMPGGVMAVNLFGRHASFEQSLQRIVQAFGSDQVWHLRATREGNTVVVAGLAVQVPGREELKSRASALEQRFFRQGLPATQWLRMVRPYRPPEGLADADARIPPATPA
ncbi:MAG: spermidine synthase [Rubrivivax sp.]|nr:spermidine synthase [Rubrivivax sp.]